MWFRCRAHLGFPDVSNETGFLKLEDLFDSVVLSNFHHGISFCSGPGA